MKKVAALLYFLCTCLLYSEQGTVQQELHNDTHDSIWISFDSPPDYAKTFKRHYARLSPDKAQSILTANAQVYWKSCFINYYFHKPTSTLNTIYVEGSNVWFYQSVGTYDEYLKWIDNLKNLK